MTSRLRDYFRAEPELDASVERLASRLSLMRSEGLNSILLTSAWPGEGKSSLALHLAFHLVDLGVDILLVDADLRKPTLTVLLEAGDREGLAETLSGARVEPLLIEQGLKVLGAGQERELALQRLGRGDFQPVIEAWTRESAMVLVDGPPLSVAPDSGLIAESVAGVVFVVLKSRFRGGPEGNFVEDLRDAGVNLVGSVVVGYRDALLGHAQQRPAHRLLRLLGLLR